MKYNIKAIPTTYAGVNFRSRLEARWAAFFDLCGWKWDYEPFDLDGWAPDFRVRTSVGPVLCEVKPCDIRTFIESALGGSTEPWPFDGYNKAARHMDEHFVCLLGDEPLTASDWSMPIGVIDRTPQGIRAAFDRLHDALTPAEDAETAWREAGNRTQWQPSTEYKTVRQMLAAAKAKSQGDVTPKSPPRFTSLTWRDPNNIPRRTRIAA